MKDIGSVWLDELFEKNRPEDLDCFRAKKLFGGSAMIVQGGLTAARIFQLDDCLQIINAKPGHILIPEWSRARDTCYWLARDVLFS